MKENTLRNYLKRILELEKNKLELEQTLSRINQKKYEPKIIEVDEIAIKSKNTTSGFLGIIGGVIGFFVGAFIGGPNFLILAIFIVVGYLGGYSIDSSNNDAKINSEIEKEKSAVEKQNMKSISTANKKNKIITTSASKINSALVSTKIELDSLYAKNYIYPKYRNMVAIASIYEYIDSGRCDDLEGANGAYNIFELEVRLDRIITKLDIIIRSLEQIKSNQYYLYNAITSIKPQIDKISNAVIENANRLDEISANTAISAYTAQVIERNQYYGRNWNDGTVYRDRVNMPKI